MRVRRLTTYLVLFALFAGALAGAAAAADAPLAVQNVDSSAYPEMELTVSLPPAQSGARPEFSVAENGRAAKGVSASPVSAGVKPANVVLVIDTSGSMSEGQLADAQRAANRFAESLGNGASIAIVAFSDKPEIVTGFTSDSAEIKNAIASLTASGETSLYDALVAAAKLVPASSGTRRSIVVLSDGGDTVSDSSFDAAVAALSKAGAPLYAVALKSAEYNPNALATLARETGGRLVPVTRSSDLTGLFESIAKEIGNTWTVTYRSTKPRTADIELDIEATTDDLVASARTVVANPAIDEMRGSRSLVLPKIQDDPAALFGAVALAFVSVALLVMGILLIVMRDRPNLGQLKFYDQLHDDAGDAAQGGAGDTVRTAVVDAVGAVAGKRGLIALAAGRLEGAGMPLRPAEYITGHILLVVIVGVATELLTEKFALAVLMVVVATMVPLIALDIAVDRRRRRFEEQLPDVLAMLAGSLRGGWGVQQAIALAAQEAPEPSAAELKRVETETRLGMPLERSLDAMAVRMDSADFASVVTAVAIQREVGGNLAEVLDVVGRTIREREAVRRQLRALTAEGRLSAYILIALPFLVFAMLMIINPGYLVPFLTTSVGLALLALAVFLLVVGSVWMYRVSRIEV